MLLKGFSWLNISILFAGLFVLLLLVISQFESLSPYFFCLPFLAFILSGVAMGIYQIKEVKK